MFKPGPIVAIGVAIVLLLASPFGFGMLAESNVREEIERMNSNAYAALEVTDYQRGWFSSHVTIDLAPGGPLLDAMSAQDPMLQTMIGDVSAPFSVEVNHGPVLTLNGFGFGSYAVKAGLDSSVDWVSTVESELGISSLIELRGRAGILSAFEFEGEISPFEYVDQSESLTFTGLEFTGQTDGTVLSFESNAEALALQSTFLSFTLEGLGIDGDSVLRPDTFALGGGEFRIDHFAASNPLLGATETVAIDGLRVSGDVSLNESDNVDYAVMYEVAGFMTQGSPMFSDIAIGVNLLDLDAQAVHELFALLQSAAGADPLALQMQMLPIMNGLVTAGPTLTLDPIRFTMDGQALTGNLAVTIDPAALPTGQVMDLMDPNVAMNALSANLELDASKELMRDLAILSLGAQMGPQLEGLSESEIDSMMAQQADQMIAMLVVQGMLNDNGDSWSTTVTFENGAATVNGMPVPLGSMGLF